MRKFKRPNQHLSVVKLEDRLTPAGGFNAPTIVSPLIPADVRPAAVAVADFNGDGRLDLAVANPNGNSSVSVLLNRTGPNGNTVGSFGPQASFATGRGPSSIAVGDFNGDGRPDLAVANSGDGSVSILLNRTPNGNTVGNFGPQQALVTGRAPSAVAVGDVNGDGRPDLAVANELDNTFSLFLNRAAPNGATFANFGPQQAFVTGRGPSALAVGDFNGDRQPDLAVTNRVDNTFSVFLNRTPSGNTVGSFTGQTAFATGRGPSAIAVGDFNGDGRPDLAVANSADDTVSVVLNRTPVGNTVGSFNAQTAFAVGRNPTGLAVGDFNGDGRLDLAVSNRGDDTVSVLLNRTPSGNTVGSFAAQTVFATGHGPSAVAAGDFNGDGRPDLAIIDFRVGDPTVLLR